MKVVVTIGSVDNNPYEYVATIKSVEKYTEKLKLEYNESRGYRITERDNGKSISFYPIAGNINIRHYDFYTEDEWKNRFLKP